MIRDQAHAMFSGTGFKVSRTTMISNQYWPVCDQYRQISYDQPWWLVTTDKGVFMVGWRKRVIEIRCITDLPPFVSLEKIVPDDVTKSKDLVHAWSYEKAVNYMSLLYKTIVGSEGM